MTDDEARLAEDIRAALLIEDALADDPPPGTHRVVASPRLRVHICKTPLLRRGYHPPRAVSGSLPSWAVAPEHSRRQAESLAEILREDGDHAAADRLLAGLDDQLAAEERKFQEYLRRERGALDH
jgi:hypothetical protein